MSTPALEITNKDPLTGIRPTINLISNKGSTTVNDLNSPEINLTSTIHLGQDNYFRNDLNSFVNSQDFWSKFALDKSKGDGHCLLYSIISSAASQLALTVELEKLKHLITSEIYSNFKTYLPTIENNSFNVLESQMLDYIDRKVYNSSFGDIVPVICSKVLNIGLCIVSSRESRHRCEIVFYDDSQPIIYLYKKNDHYDGIVYSKTSCPT